MLNIAVKNAALAAIKVAFCINQFLNKTREAPSTAVKKIAQLDDIKSENTVRDPTKIFTSSSKAENKYLLVRLAVRRKNPLCHFVYFLENPCVAVLYVLLDLYLSIPLL